ncbi:MAG: hypothetical protein MRECE_50c002 [Mycoplasmataceae bacterium CE_OT135]|nr:MAG: hypothetical protein MRECE_50c002 [Mycoplasmataceae bacterium CE_OT135]
MKGKLTELKNEYDWWQKGFTLEQRKDWIIAGAKLDDHGFVAWLRDVKNETPEWISNYKEDYQALSERFKKYGLCQECNRPNTGEQWCQDCNEPRIKKDFAKWTSHNPKVDAFIQKYQLQATDADKFLEWIPYEQFTEVEYLAEGGFGKVYKAQWTKGNIHHWDNDNKQWHQEKDHYYEEEDKQKEDFEENKDKYKKYKNHREVVLKSLTNSQENTDFLEETANHKIIDDWFNNIVPCYGLSQDPQTGNYLMVMQYIERGDLRKYLKNKNLSFKNKLFRLVNIAQGLKDIHQKNLVHRDFHSGNILNNDIHSFITDLGLCKPADEINKGGKFFGVLPYVAPEVLNKKGYTPASDIYSWGMVAYEVISGLPPYHDLPHNNYLALKICEGVRPRFRVKIPALLKDLIERCWDADPKKRPTANELNRILNNWVGEVKSQRNTEFFRQFKEREQFLNNLTSFDYKIHPSAFYTSRRLDFENLPEPQNSKEINEQFYKSQEEFGSSDISMSGLLDNLPSSEETQQPEQQALQIQPPYSTPSSSKNN